MAIKIKIIGLKVIYNSFQNYTNDLSMTIANRIKLSHIFISLALSVKISPAQLQQIQFVNKIAIC